MPPAEKLNRMKPIIMGGEWQRDTSFGAVYEGEVFHVSNGDGERTNGYVESVPRLLTYPGSGILVAGGYMSSAEHYAPVQKALGDLGEHSVFVDHVKHGGYEIGHNAEDIYFTAKELAANGVKKQIWIGHSRGGPEVLEAHELAREWGLDAEVTDIVLAFPAKFISGFPLELLMNSPKFVAEYLYGFKDDPVRQLKFGAQVLRNVLTDVERTIKEGLYLLTNETGNDLCDRMDAGDHRPRLHFVVGLFDGLVPGKAVLKAIEDRQHDTLTILRTGHISMNNAPQVTEIIHGRVRGYYGNSLVA